MCINKDVTLFLTQSWYTISGKGCFYIRKIKGSHISDEQDYNIVSQQYGLSLPESTCVLIEIQVVEPGVCSFMCMQCNVRMHVHIVYVYVSIYTCTYMYAYM